MIYSMFYTISRYNYSNVFTYDLFYVHTIIPTFLHMIYSTFYTISRYNYSNVFTYDLFYVLYYLTIQLFIPIYNVTYIQLYKCTDM